MHARLLHTGFFLGFSLDAKGGGDMFHRNVRRLSIVYKGVMYQKIGLFTFEVFELE
jgi:hypothetical protein